MLDFFEEAYWQSTDILFLPQLSKIGTHIVLLAAYAPFFVDITPSEQYTRWQYRNWEEFEKRIVSGNKHFASWLVSRILESDSFLRLFGGYMSGKIKVEQLKGIRKVFIGRWFCNVCLRNAMDQIHDPDLANVNCKYGCQNLKRWGKLMVVDFSFASQK